MRKTPFKQKPYDEVIAKKREASQRAVAKKRAKMSEVSSKEYKPRKSTKSAQIRRKKGIWATSTADSYFSVYIRDRDGHCLRCGITENLTCSHFHGRGHSSTRFDPLNNIALCATCHAEWEGPKAEYKEFQRNLIGIDNYLKQDIKAGTFKQRSEAVAEWKELYKKMKEENTYPLPLSYFL